VNLKSIRGFNSMEEFEFIIPDFIKKIMEHFETKGFQAFLVGGCVRDFILGKIPSDYDIATNALPAQVKEIFKQFTVVETGIEHGTVTIVTGVGKVEVTTYRIDGKYKDGRRPEGVFYTDTIEQDLARRDFTINAIAYSPERGIIDPYGGQGDIKRGIIRCVGDPDKRFKEDYLRILRGIRFVSVTGFSLERNTAEAMKRVKTNISFVAVERIREEFIKILCGEYVEKALLEHREFIETVIPTIGKSFDFNQNNPYHIFDVYRHTVEVVKNTPSQKALRLAAFFHDIGKPFTYSEDKKGIGHFYGHGKVSTEITKEVMSNLKFDNETKTRVKLLVKYHDREILPDKKAIKKFLIKNPVSLMEDLLILKKADISGQNPKLISRLEEIEKIGKILKEIVEEGACFTLKDLAIKGDDLIKLGIKPGKNIGEILNDCLNKVVNEELSNTCAELIKYVKIKETQGAQGDGSSVLLKNDTEEPSP